MFGLIPVFKVNYTVNQLFSALFISNSSTVYREKLKSQICEYFGVKDTLLTSSARCALYMLFNYLPHKKVIVPAYTCEVVIDAAKLANKNIEFVHVSKKTLNVLEYEEIDSDSIVIATHQYGLPCEIEKLVTLCKRNNAVLIEDCAGSLGSKVNGKLTGTFGDYAVFSFSASKMLHSPTKGGFIIANNESSLSEIKKSISFSLDENNFKIKQLIKAVGFCINKNRVACSVLGKLQNMRSKQTKCCIYNSDISYKANFYEWQAYVLVEQFKYIDKFINERKKHVQTYDCNLNNSHIQKIHYTSECVNTRYPILVKNRCDFIKWCKEHYIQVGLGYSKPIIPENFNEENEINLEIVYLPLGAGYSDNDIKYVISIVNSFKQ